MVEEEWEAAWEQKWEKEGKEEMEECLLRVTRKVNTSPEIPEILGTAAGNVANHHHHHHPEISPLE